MNPKVFVDFHNCDPQRWPRLTSVGTLEDLSRQQIQLREGLVLALYADDGDENSRENELRCDGTVTFSTDEHCWVAVIDWNAVRHASDELIEPIGSQPR